MSVEENIWDEVGRIVSTSIEEISEYLKERAANGPCEACGSVKWIVRTANDKPVLLQAPFYQGSDEVDVFFSTLCTSCGNTRLFNARYVSRYLHAIRSQPNG